MSLAQQYGIAGALILKNIYYWILKNKSRNKNYYDGSYWTFNTITAFQKNFPYLTKRQIYYTFEKLIKNGLIIKRHYSKQLDRTCWYTLSQKGLTILQNCKMQFTNMKNANNKIVKSIYKDTNIDTNTEQERQLSQKQQEFLLQIKKLCPNKNLNITSWLTDTELDKLLLAIKNSNFLLNRNNLSLQWCFDHYKEIVEDRNYENHNQRHKSFSNERDYTEEELSEYFQLDNIDEIQL